MFGQGNQEELFFVKLINRQRHPQESLPELAHDVRKLVKLALPKITHQQSQVLAKKFFVNAISDSALRLNILCAKPATFDAAVRIAMETESIYKAEKFRRQQHVEVDDGLYVDSIFKGKIEDGHAKPENKSGKKRRRNKKSPSGFGRVSAWKRFNEEQKKTVSLSQLEEEPEQDTSC
jgi:hypothetical protein